MRILLSNDDGYFSPGIECLARALADVADITVNGLAGNDTLTVDFTNGNPLPTGGITYHAGGDPGAPGGTTEAVCPGCSTSDSAAILRDR